MGRASFLLQMPVTVNALVADGYLDCWMDFNLDQDWDDADEHVFT
ncbi:MAG: hypothetical protein R2750_02300 [Bacteroidales bacterium]